MSQSNKLNYDITTIPSPRLGMYTSHNVPKEHILLIPCFLEAGQFVFNRGLSLFHKQLFSSPECSDVSRSESSETSPCCNLSLLLLQACEILIQTNGGACQLGSGLELVYTKCLCVFSSKCTSTLPSAASFLDCNRLALTHITDVFIFSDSKATATLELSAESPPGYLKFLKMAFSSFLCLPVSLILFLHSRLCKLAHHRADLMYPDGVCCLQLSSGCTCTQALSHAVPHIHRVKMAL